MEPCRAADLPSMAMLLQVQRDYNELPAEAVAALRDSLFALLLRYAKDSPAVRTQLCLALAALAAHAPAALWGEQGVLGWLMNAFSSQPREVALSCMLELMTVLPQVGAGTLCFIGGAGAVVCVSLTAAGRLGTHNRTPQQGTQHELGAAGPYCVQ